MISYNPIIIFLSPTPLLPLSSSLSSLTHVCMLGCFSHPTLCNPMDHNQPGSSVQGFLQARIQVHCHALFQGIFPTQGSNLHLFMSPALASMFFTTSATWGAHPHSQSLVKTMLVFFFGCTMVGTWDLSFLTKDQTQAP